MHTLDRLEGARPWALTGDVVDYGPDNEPLLVCVQRYRKRLNVGATRLPIAAARRLAAFRRADSRPTRTSPVRPCSSRPAR